MAKLSSGDPIERFEPRWPKVLGLFWIATLIAIAVVGNWWPDALSRDAAITFVVVWTPSVLLLVIVTAIITHMRRRKLVRAEQEGLCVNCGYDLRESSGRCPECGEGTPYGNRANITDNAVRFRPSHVEGVAGVTDVCVFTDALELISADERRIFRWIDVARGREIASGLAPVGEMKFSKPSVAESHFTFDTTPRITVYMPTDGPAAYPRSHFWQVQRVLRAGGFKVYEDGTQKVRPWVITSRPGHTILYVLMVLAVSWAYALSGHLLGSAGRAWREFLISNSHNPPIALAFVLPATVIPVMVGFRHGRSVRALAVIILGSYLLVLFSRWTLQRAISPWAQFDRSRDDMAFWSMHNLGTVLIVTTLATLLGWGWRRGCLEPIQRRKHSDTQ